MHFLKIVKFIFFSYSSVNPDGNMLLKSFVNHPIQCFPNIPEKISSCDIPKIKIDWESTPPKKNIIEFHLPFYSKANCHQKHL